MEIRKYGTKKILIADTNKHIRSIDDVPREDEEGNVIEPYYASVIFLADNFDTETIILTISAIATFVGAITGISNVNYNKNNK